MSSFKPAIARPAVIVNTNIAAQTCTIQYSDRCEPKDYTCPMPHPFAGAGWGIFTGPTRGTRVMVDTTIGDQPFIVSTISMNQYAKNFDSVGSLNNIDISQAGYPRVLPGEIAIQSQAGSLLLFDKQGTVQLSNRDIKLEYSNSGTAALNYQSSYTNTEAHREVSGLTRRDLRAKPRKVEELQDKLTSVDTDRFLSTIGRNPNLDPSLLTLSSGNKATRNPVLAEHRSLVYEFARTNMADRYADEAERVADPADSSSVNFLAKWASRRDMARTDVFNLGPHAPNNLIERIEGTAVDIYGNLLDINRNIIDFSQVGIGDEHRIEHENILLRRAIKYHFEINSRKHKLDIEGDSDNLDSHNLDDEACENGYSFSRWSVDVDGEGLTKINIPSSSNVGNIPLLVRHVNQHDVEDRNAGDFRPTTETGGSKRDVQHVPFGNLEGLGVAVPQDYAPPNITKDGKKIVYRTAYHDAIGVAEKIFDDIGTGFPVNTELTNDLRNANAAAGGRSIHANLDGSLELNIGRDVADKKSILLDTAGSLIAHLGKDKKNNSVVAQTDGDVLLQVGGASVRGEEVLASNAVRFYVSTASGNSFHKIEITQDGILITSATDSNIVIQSQKNLILSAKGQTFIGGERISVYGDYSELGSTISSHRHIGKAGGVI